MIYIIIFCYLGLFLNFFSDNYIIFKSFLLRDPIGNDNIEDNKRNKGLVNFISELADKTF